MDAVPSPFDTFKSVFPTCLINSKTWITCRENKAPLVGTSIAPAYTFDELPWPCLPGFCFQSEQLLIGIDLDNCIDAIGNPNSFALWVLNLLPKNTYVEYSVSGKGIHIIGTFIGKLEHWKNNFQVELYTSKRYFCVTGRLVGTFTGSSETLPDLTKLIETLKLHFEPLPGTQTITPNDTPTDEADFQAVPAMLAALDPNCPYPEWRDIGFALGNSFNQTKYRLAVAKLFYVWSSKSKKFNAEAKTLIAEFFDPNREDRGLSLGSLYKAVPAALAVKQRAQATELVQVCDWEESLGLVAEHIKEKGLLHGLADASTPTVTVETPEVIPDEPPSGEPEGEEQPLHEFSYHLHPNDVAEHFIEKNQCFTPDGKKVFLWLGTYWASNSSVAYLSNLVFKFIIAERHNWKMQGSGVNRHPVVTFNMKSSEIKEVLDAIMRIAAHSPELNVQANTWFDADRRLVQPYVVAVQNGLLDVETGKIFSPLTKEFYNTAVLPCDWNSAATCPRFLTGLHDMFLGDDMQTEGEVQDNIDCLQLWFGYLFLVGYSEKKLCVLLGDSDSGKSTLMKVMSLLVGSQYYMALNNKSLTESGTDYGVGFDTKFLGGYDEFPFDTSLNKVSAAIKTFTGDAQVSQRALYTEGKTVDMRMKIVFTSNTTPSYFSDNKGALMNRLLIWNCFAVPEAKRDRNYLKYLRENELAGILAWAIKGAQRILAGEHLRQPGGESAVIHQEFRDSSKDHVAVWLESEFVEQEGATLFNSTMYNKLIKDAQLLRYKNLANWLNTTQWTQKTYISKIRQAVADGPFRSVKKYKNDTKHGFKNLAPRKKVAFEDSDED